MQQVPAIDLTPAGLTERPSAGALDVCPIRALGEVRGGRGGRGSTKVPFVDEQVEALGGRLSLPTLVLLGESFSSPAAAVPAASRRSLELVGSARVSGAVAG